MNTKIIQFIAWSLLSLSVQAAPTIEHWQTSNGARVYFIAAPELPMVDVQVIFDAGAARDGAQAGVALVTNGLLVDGAGDMDADQIATAFDEVGAQISFSSARDMAMVSLRSLTDAAPLKSALSTFETVLNSPTFPADALARQHKQLQVALRGEKQSPSALSSRAFYKALYGTHPYASMPMGDESTVSGITQAKLKSFYQQYYVGKNAVVAIVGAVDKTQATAIAEQVVGRLPAGKKAANLPAVAMLEKADTIHIPHPASQTHIAMGQPGIKRGDKDYFALYVGNHILGGSSLVSLLSNEVREKRGLSYSVYSYFRPMRELGPYQFGLQTRNDQADEALKVMRDTLDKFIKQGPTEAELTAAKRNLTGGFALRLASNRKVMGYLGMLAFYDMPMDYLDTFKTQVDAVTVAQIKEAFKRRIDPDKMVTILVGGKAE